MKKEESIKDDFVPKKHVHWRKKLIYIGEKMQDFDSTKLKDYNVLIYLPKKYLAH